MAVFARPAQDISRATWTTHTGGTVNLWQAIDDDPADDATYIQSALAANDTYEVKLSSVAPAIIPRNHSLIIRGRKDTSGGNPRGVDVALVQGTTIIGSTSFLNLQPTVQQQTVAVPKAWAAQITDYSDLRYRITGNGTLTGTSARRRARVTDIVLRVPEATDLVDDLLTRWTITTGTANGNVTASRSGFTGEGPTLAYAIWSLYQKMQEAEWQEEAVESRFQIAYYLWKSIEYQRLRAEIVAGTYQLPPHQTQVEAIAIVDAKLQRFIDIVRLNDSGESD
jgi:hypothetical protein